MRAARRSCHSCSRAPGRSHQDGPCLTAPGSTRPTSRAEASILRRPAWPWRQPHRRKYTASNGICLYSTPSLLWRPSPGALRNHHGNDQLLWHRFRSLPGQPHAITGGVAEALIATATGLSVAILTLVPYNYFRVKTEAMTDLIEERVTRLELILKACKMQEEQ